MQHRDLEVIPTCFNNVHILLRRQYFHAFGCAGLRVGVRCLCQMLATMEARHQVQLPEAMHLVPSSGTQISVPKKDHINGGFKSTFADAPLVRQISQRTFLRKLEAMCVQRRSEPR